MEGRMAFGIGGIEMKDVFTIGELARLMDTWEKGILPSWDDIYEYNIDFLGEVYRAVYEEAIKEGYTDDEAIKIAEEEEGEALDELFNKWCNGIEYAIRTLLEYHFLTLKTIKECEKYKIVPMKGKTWKDAAEEITETINGHGLFYYPSVIDFLRAGPYKSYKEAVLSHIPWIYWYPKVYGTESISSLFEYGFK